MTIDTKKLRELAEKATPGKWFVDEWKHYAERKRRFRIRYEATDRMNKGAQFDLASVEAYGSVSGERVNAANAAFIAAASPSTVLALLDHLAASQAECERLRELAVTPMQRAADLDQAVCEETAGLRSHLETEKALNERHAERNRKALDLLGIKYPGLCNEHVWGGGIVEGIEDLQRKLSAMTKARDEACELAMNPHIGTTGNERERRIQELRRVGREK